MVNIYAEGEIFIRWCSATATTTKGVRRVRVRKSTRQWGDWKDVDRWLFYKNADLFDEKGDAIEDGERRRKERREYLQRLIDKLANPMRVVEKIKEIADAHDGKSA